MFTSEETSILLGHPAFEASAELPLGWKQLCGGVRLDTTHLNIYTQVTWDLILTCAWLLTHEPTPTQCQHSQMGFGVAKVW